ncbi:MAG TPA: polar amino acid ABC transporter ATP-binding protein [Lachnospiraceae bacterium]|nr:polar amino acid ABC transporter ATP-binding protein [Lachnospiraceae bacterium]
MAVLEVKNIGKHFGSTNVLDDVSFTLEEGKALAIIGSSGSGKTTLLRCLNFLETPDHGSITVKGETLFDADNPAKGQGSDLRTKRLHFGMVFQAFHLFPQYTALENVTLAEKLLAKEQPDFKQKKKEIYEKIDAHGKELLNRMGLSERMQHYPHQLSGGQQQRVAIARSLAAKPDIIFADEPTGNLDSKSGGEVMELLKSVSGEMEKTLVVITHDSRVASMAGRRLSIVDGRLLEVTEG